MISRKNYMYFKSQACTYGWTIALGYFLKGFSLSESVIHNLYKKHSMSLSTSTRISNYVVIISGLLGALLGFKIVSSFLTHQIEKGRQKTILWASALAVGILTLNFLPVPNFYYHLVLSGLFSFIVGFYSFLCPLFIYEIAPIKQRGWMIALCPFSETLGQFFTKLIKKGLTNQHKWVKEVRIGTVQYLVPYSSDLSLKTLIAFLIFLVPIVISISMVYLFCRVFNKETPTYLLQNSQQSQIKTSLTEIYHPSSLQDKMDDLLSEERWSLENHHKTLKLSLLCLLLVLISQIAANNPFMIQYAQSKVFCSISVFSLLGNAAIALGLTLFVSCLHSISRKVIMVGSILLTLSIEATILSMYLDVEQHSIFTFMLGLFYFFILGTSMMPLVVILPVELLDTRPLSLLVASSYFIKLLILVVTGAIFRYDQSNLAYLSIWGEVIAVIGVIVLMILFPETNSKTKVQILKRESVVDARDSILSAHMMQSFNLREQTLEN